MTPKEKAEELYNKIYGKTPTRWTELEIEEDKKFAKQCALITCNEVLGYMGADRGTEFWQKVKQEIQKL